MLVKEEDVGQDGVVVNSDGGSGGVEGELSTPSSFGTATRSIPNRSAAAAAIA